MLWLRGGSIVLHQLIGTSCRSGKHIPGITARFLQSNSTSKFHTTLPQSASIPSSDSTPQPRPHKRSLARRIFGVFLIGPKIHWLIKKSNVVIDEDMITLLSTAGALSIYTILGITAMKQFGFDTTPFMAGFSFAGAAVGFGVKDIAQNYLAGIILVLDKHFERFNVVTVGSDGRFTGRVIKVDIRHVVLEDSDGHVILVPSSEVFAHPLTIHKDKMFPQQQQQQQQQQQPAQPQEKDQQQQSGVANPLSPPPPPTTTTTNTAPTQPS